MARMRTSKPSRPLSAAFLVCCQLVVTTVATQCGPDSFVYGANGIMDDLLTCSLSKTFDLDLTPQGNQIKSTSKTLVDQGLSNRTSILHARLSGIWTAKRPSFITTGWRCGADGSISSTAIIELSSLSLEVVEKLDVPIHRNQHKLAMHRPCRTFDLPTWMCRQSKPIYRTITTWVNRAYYNLTLVQRAGYEKPSIAKLDTMFTCPETFKQKITHSPSSTYLLSRHLHGLPQGPAYVQQQQQAKKGVKREAQHAKSWPGKNNIKDELPSLGHPSSFTTTQSGNMPASPPYHNSVRLVLQEVTRVLSASIDNCLGTLDSDLSLVSDYRSFKEQKYDLDEDEAPSERDSDDAAFNQEQAHTGIANECSNKVWIKSRIEAANQVTADGDGAAQSGSRGPYQNGPTKRNKISLNYPDDPNRLLDPYAHYHDGSAAQMIDDTN